MTYLVIGSAAAEYSFGPDWPRPPKDWDAFSNQNHTGEDVYWDDRMLPWLEARDKTNKSMYATPNELYTIKLSHTEWELKNGSWNKHMNDLLWMQQKGCRADEELYQLLRSVWLDRYGDRKFDLSADKRTFFDDGVRRKYDHDSLHRSVACRHPGRPLYEDFLKEGAEVDMDMKKIFEWMERDKWSVLDLFYEEIAVTALERKVIPSDYTCSPMAAWSWAVRRTVTSLTKGKSSRFIRENYGFYKTPPYDYIKAHKQGARFLEAL